MADEEVGVTSLSLLALTLATNEGERLPVTPHTYEAEAIGIDWSLLDPHSVPALYEQRNVQGVFYRSDAESVISAYYWMYQVMPIRPT
jgi:hypothetical protein